MIVRDAPFQQQWCQVCAGAVISIAATPNCSLICAATVEHRAYLFDHAGNSLWTEPLTLENEAWATAISADGTTIAFGTASKKPAGGRVHVVDSTGRTIWIQDIGAPVWGLSLSDNGEFLAVSSWNNTASLFRKTNGTYSLVQRITIPEARGLYGITLTGDGSRAAVAAYDYGLVILDRNFAIEHVYTLATGTYNVHSIGNDEVILGLRDGRAVLARLQAPYTKLESAAITSRPVCGADASNDGGVMALGSFDGRLYVADRSGRLLWKYTTDGEVWSTATSTDGRFVVIGSGDHTVRLFANHCSASVLQETAMVEQALDHADGAQLELTLKRLVRLYLTHGLVDYGKAFLKERIARSSSPYLLRQYLRNLLEDDIKAHPSHHGSQFDLGVICAEAQLHVDAVKHFQNAAREPDLRSRALAMAGDSFSALNLPTATASCYRRARERHLDAEAQRLLYNMGRAYEERRAFVEATRHYELLASWGLEYRDTWQRLSRLSWLNKNNNWDSTAESSVEESLTSSLLGPDVPRANELDDSLTTVLAARASESLVAYEERAHLQEILHGLLRDEEYMRGITGYGLAYSMAAYLKYDYSLPEDELKKLLETVQLLHLLGKHRIEDSLDIGAATGRYPTLFYRRGVRAVGIDSEAQAIEYAYSKHNGSDKRPHLVVGDARNLPFEAQSFDLVTCMMGTFAHIPMSDHQAVLQSVLRVLRPGGRVAISTWDVECEHLDYLSMYNEAQKEQIRKNSLRQDEIAKLLKASGFTNVVVRPFCLLSQLVVYDLSLERLSPRDLAIAVHADVAARGTLAERHGEMYIAMGTKP